jgi:transcriptional regulator with XRE-family HTH domain
MRNEPVARAFGQAIRNIREASGARQDDVARAARAAGLSWTAASVAALETGRRSLAIDEVARLPLMLRRLGLALGWEDAAITITASPTRVAVTVAGENFNHETGVNRLVGSARVTSHATGKLTVAETGSTQGGDHQSEAVLDEGGVLEQRIARRFKVDVRRVVAAARQRWGRSISEERDRRTEGAPAGASKRALQTLRGHVTRELLAELRPDLSTRPWNRKRV